MLQIRTACAVSFRKAKAAPALNHPDIAHIYEIGESDGTYFIERVRRRRDPIFIKVDPMFKNLRGEPRYKDVLKRLKLAE